MLLAWALACAGSPDASPDGDSWLQGSFVDEFQPDVSEVMVSFRQTDPVVYLDVVYWSGDLVALELTYPLATKDFDPHDAGIDPIAETDYDTAWGGAPYDLTWSWTDEEQTEVEGSFGPVHFETWDEQTGAYVAGYDVTGTFRGVLQIP